LDGARNAFQMTRPTGAQAGFYGLGNLRLTGHVQGVALPAVTKTIDIGQELQDIIANEELLAFFDFVLPLADAGGARELEGLCKVSRPRERRSRATYLSVFFVVDLPDPAAYRALDAQLRRIEWSAGDESAAGIDCVVPIPHRAAGGGLFLKEVDVYLDGTRRPDAAFVREVLQPGLARAVGLRAGDLTVWDEAAATANDSLPNGRETLVSRLRRFGNGA
jgi:hypothetical protein